MRDCESRGTHHSQTPAHRPEKPANQPHSQQLDQKHDMKYKLGEKRCCFIQKRVCEGHASRFVFSGTETERRSSGHKKKKRGIITRRGWKWR